MGVHVTLDLPEELARRAQAAAAQSQRPLEEVLVEWLDLAGKDRSVDLLPDDQLLEVCDSTLEQGQQESLSELLERNREGSLTPADREQLDALMQVYRRDLVRKAQALQAAAARGLRNQL
jgi:hypothetical protein